MRQYRYLTVIDNPRGVYYREILWGIKYRATHTPIVIIRAMLVSLLNVGHPALHLLYLIHHGHEVVAAAVLVVVIVNYTVLIICIINTNGMDRFDI